VSFKFGGVEKHIVFLFVLFVCFVCFCLLKYIYIYCAMLLLSMSYTVTMVAFRGFVYHLEHITTLGLIFSLERFHIF
jgi:hypothetical protein